MELFSLPGLDANYSYNAGFSLPVTVDSSASVSFNYSVDVLSTAVSSFDTLDARLSGVFPSTSDPINLSGGLVTHAWQVQQRPSLSLTDLTISPDTVSAGKTDILITYNVINDGDASAQLNSAVSQLTRRTAV